MFARFVSFVVVILFLKLPKSKLVNEAVALEAKPKFKTNTSDPENPLAYKKFDSLVQELLVTFVALNSLYDSAQSEEFNNTETRLSKAWSDEDETEKPYFQGTSSFFVDEHVNKNEDEEHDSVEDQQETLENAEVSSENKVNTGHRSGTNIEEENQINKDHKSQLNIESDFVSEHVNKNEDEEHEQDTFKNEEVPTKKKVHTDTHSDAMKIDEDNKQDTYKNKEIPAEKKLYTVSSTMKINEENEHETFKNEEIPSEKKVYTGSGTLNIEEENENDTFKNEDVPSEKNVHTGSGTMKIEDENEQDTFKNEDVLSVKKVYTDSGPMKINKEYVNNKDYKLVQKIEPIVQFESSNETTTKNLSKYKEHEIVSSESEADKRNSDEKKLYVAENPNENAHRSNTEIKNNSSSFGTQNAVKFLNSIGDFNNYHKLSRRGTLNTNSKLQYKESEKYDISAAYYPISMRASGFDDTMANNKILKLQIIMDPMLENLKLELEKSVADVKERKERFRSDLIKQIIAKRKDFRSNAMRQANLTGQTLKQQANSTQLKLKQAANATELNSKQFNSTGLNLERQANSTEPTLKREANSTEQHLQVNSTRLNFELQSNSTVQNLKRQQNLTSLDLKSFKTPQA